MAKRVNTRRIRANRSYDISEAAKACDVTAWTIRNWIRQGLPVLDAERPMLISGQALKAFLAGRKIDAKTKLKSGELYCPTCRASTRPMGGEIEVKTHGRRFSVQALCECCGKMCSRFVRASQISDFSKITTLPALTPTKPKGTPKPVLKSITGGRQS